MAAIAIIFWLVVLGVAVGISCLALFLSIAILSTAAILTIAAASLVAASFTAFFLRRKLFPNAHLPRIPTPAFYPACFAFVVLTHLNLLGLPYFWDEGGYYIPAALDFLHTGTLIPQSTITNAHPPFPMVLLATLWRITGFHIVATRLFVCAIAAAGLLAVFHLARTWLGDRAAAAVTLLTALYPVWYVQSTLAHADIFAATFTLSALALYLPAVIRSGRHSQPTPENHRPPERSAAESEDLPHLPATQARQILPPPVLTSARLTAIALLFTAAVLSKETAIVIPFALGCERLYVLLRRRITPCQAASQIAAVSFCILPLLAWYGYHFHRTGFVFGNPEYLRYNATANMDARRICVALYHRALHLIGHMNMWFAVALTAACFILPRRRNPILTPPDSHPERSEGSAFFRSTKTSFQAKRSAAEKPLYRPFFRSITGLSSRPAAEPDWKGLHFAPAHLILLILTQWIAFSILGGALLTRYLLPAYPLLLILFVAIWQSRTRVLPLLAGLTAAAFLLALHHNPPYAFAPEDNLTYRDMIVIHQQAVALIEQQYPAATVLTAWPAAAELDRTFLGYTHIPIKTVAILNFSREELEKAAIANAAQSATFDTALIFSTKNEPPAGRTDLSTRTHTADARYFDFHRDLSPAEAAQLLHGTVIWQAQRRGEWAAVLRFPPHGVMDAALTPLPTN